jgi:succinoglycan biosynthesis transport protein ExoP
VSNNIPVTADGKWIIQHQYADRPAASIISDAADSSAFDVQRLIQSLIHWRLMILGSILTGLVLGVLVALITTPMYRAKVVLEVNPPTVEVVDEKSRPQTGGSNGDLVATQIGLLSSRATAERAAQELNLASKKDFGGTKGTATERLRRATDIVSAGIKVKPPLTGTLIEYSFSSPSQALSAAVANQIANSFISGGLQRRYDASSYARKFLSEQIAKTRTDLERTERQLVAYAQSQGIINTASAGKDGQGTGDVNSLQGESLVALNQALGVATAKRVEAEGVYQQGMSVGATTDVTASTAALRGQRAALQAQYSEKRTLMKPDHPDMLSLQSQINEIDRQIAREGSQVTASRRNSLLADYRAAASSERALQGRVAELKGSVLNLRGRSIQYNILQRDADTNRALYDALLQRYKEVGVAAGIGSSPVSIVDQAEVPGGPYRPNLPLNVAIGMLLGLVLGAGAAVGLDFFYDTIKTRDDVRTKLRLACLGAIPKVTTKSAFSEALRDSASMVSEAYTSVVAALRFSTEEGSPRKIMITSTQSHEGKSSTSLAMAQSMARIGKSVLLIDADLRKPVFRSSDERLGLTHLLTGNQLDPLDHVTPTQFDNLFLLGAGPIPPNPSDLLSSGRLSWILMELEKHFDIIIVDAPPVMGLADTRLLAATIVHVLFVVESGRTRRTAALETIDVLRGVGAQVIGAVLTKATGDLGGYAYYGYRYKHDSLERRSSREIKLFPSSADAGAEA